MTRLVALLLTLCCVREAHAVEKWQAESWTKRLATTSGLLKQGSYRDALRMLKRLTRDMLETLGPGDEATYVLVIPLIQTAIAEVGSGDRATGLWHWHMAQTLYPKSADSDLTAFGEPGAFLKNNVMAEPRPEKCTKTDATTPPVVLRRPEPDYPEGARQFRNQGVLIIETRIRADGSVAEPRIVKPQATPLTYAAMDALRSWKFAPARKDGVPVDAHFCLTVNFRLR